jgi:hypothetical protein
MVRENVLSHLKFFLKVFFIFALINAFNRGSCVYMDDFSEIIRIKCGVNKSLDDYSKQFLNVPQLFLIT